MSGRVIEKEVYVTEEFKVGDTVYVKNPQGRAMEIVELLEGKTVSIKAAVCKLPASDKFDVFNEDRLSHEGPTPLNVVYGSSRSTTR